MASSGQKDLPALFDRLRLVMVPVGSQLVVTRDVPGDYYVETRWIRDDGYHGYFGAVCTKKNYVSYHLIPIYVWPDLLDGLSPATLRRKQGKSCFNFTTADEELLTELGSLTERAFLRYQERGAEAHPPPRWSHPDEVLTAEESCSAQ